MKRAHSRRAKILSPRRQDASPEVRTDPLSLSHEEDDCYGDTPFSQELGKAQEQVWAESESDDSIELEDKFLSVNELQELLQDVSLTDAASPVEESALEDAHGGAFWPEDEEDDESCISCPPMEREDDGWTFAESRLGMGNVKLDCIDRNLLERKFYSTTNTIVDRVEAKLESMRKDASLQGKNQEDDRMLIWKMFLPGSALELAVGQANEGLAAMKKQSTNQEEMLDALLGFIEVGTYEESASTAFDPRERLWFRQGWPISKSRCTEVAQSLAGGSRLEDGPH